MARGGPPSSSRLAGRTPVVLSPSWLLQGLRSPLTPAAKGRATVTYLYENLLDDNFQMLCQALLVKEYPGMQCFPVGMPDGGRDAAAPEDPFATDIIVFQVKFAKAPNSIADPVRWMTDAIDGEQAKVERLIARRSIARYVLITNMPGTSHLDAGRIDKVLAHLKVALPDITTGVMWREDLDRRLDGQFDIKLRYPSLLNGPDVLRQLWERAIGGEADTRRSGALRSYLATEYERDETVRFKQAELLPSPLLQLFIDVPAEPSRERTAARVRRRGDLEAWQDAAVRAHAASTGRDRSQVRLYEQPDGPTLYEEHGGLTPLQVGAAALLLDGPYADAQPCIVLEGAPGQGKSTLAQYICQVQRIRLLGREEDSHLPAHMRAAAVALPIKLELRDVAVWLRGRDPWSEEETSHAGATTLEAAVAAHISRYSGGVSFDVADLHAVFRTTPVLLVLDALDEVADLDDRRLVVERVLEAVVRLEEQTESLQVLVTSRPTAIASAPTFPRDRFAHISLSALPRSLALDYTSKWTAVRKLDETDTKALLRVLRDKLGQPHLAELAKNTMQLSILLSLIHLRGASLPDKRTELYDTYVETFLNREAEKNDIVRDNRQLLVDIHRFLAFYLHARAESGKGSGRISHSVLRELIGSYLAGEGQPQDILDELLTGMVERVVALVSRVEGTYEFEVQPLREYFAARHLYDTAPYSPPGRERRGTKPDRFDALAPNPYWLNTTRFFAGCFSKGELADLAHRLCELVTHLEVGKLSYPRSLGLALLQDLVFTQSPAATRQVVEATFDALGLQYASQYGPSYGNILDVDGFGASVTILAPGAGQQLLEERLQKVLVQEGPFTDRVHRLSLLLAANSRLVDTARWWLTDGSCGLKGARSTGYGSG